MCRKVSEEGCESEQFITLSSVMTQVTIMKSSKVIGKILFQYFFKITV